MNRMPLGLAVSVALHAAALGLLVWFANEVPLPLDVPPPKGFEIAMNTPTEQVVPVEAAQPPPDTVPPVPPEPEKVVTATEVPIAREPEVPVVKAQEPPPPKPQPKPKPLRTVVPHPEPEPQPQLANLPPAAYAPVAPPAPNPDIAAHYRAMLSGWFESHKRYPNSARDAAEQGNAIIRFRVDSSGRVLSFGLSKGTGFPDLDQSINEMMQSAILPSFPPGLTLSYLDVSVTLHYSLTR